jgi:hypothetical protein
MTHAYLKDVPDYIRNMKWNEMINNMLYLLKTQIKSNHLWRAFLKIGFFILSSLLEFQIWSWSWT